MCYESVKLYTMFNQDHTKTLILAKSYGYATKQQTNIFCWYRKTVVEVAEGLYKQARKRRRAGDTIIPLLEVANADLAYLQ